MSSAQQLHAILVKASGLGPQDRISQDVKEATVELANAFKQSNVAVPALAELALTAPEDQVRQLAAVELRKLVNKVKAKVWVKVDKATREQIKGNLLAQLGSGRETSDLVQHSLSRVVASIARIEVPKQQWQELLPWIWGSCSAEAPKQRETGMYALFALIDTLVDVGGGGSFSQHTPQLFGLLSKTLVDQQSLTVRVFSARIVAKMIDYVENSDANDLQILQSFVPIIVDICSRVLEADDSDNITHICDVLDVLSFTDVNVLGNYFTDLIQFLLNAGQNPAYSEEARIAPLNVLLFLVKFKKSKVQSMQLSKSIITGLMPIAAQDEPEDNDEDSPARVAFRIIDTMANGLPPAQVVNPLIELCQVYASSQDPGMRKAAIMSFGVIFEGCSLYIIPHMEQLWPFVDQCLGDSNAMVRKSACIALSFMCSTISEVCAKRHAALMPYLFELVNQDYTRRHALTALDSLLEVLGENVKPYLATLMERFLALLPHVDEELKACIVGAVGSAAHAAKGDFLPYFQQTMAIFITFLQTKEEGKPLELRGITQDTIGTMAEAVGKDAFTPYFKQCMELAFESTTIESSSLRECSFIFFATMSRVYQEDFAQFLPTIVPLMLASLVQDDRTDNAVVAQDSGFDSRTETPTNGAPDLDDDELYEDLDEEGLEEALLGANSAIATEKEMAADALDDLFTNTKSHFLVYVPKTLDAYKELRSHYNDGLRRYGATCALHFITLANELTNPPKWKAGMNSPPLQADVQAMVEAIVPDVLELWGEEDDREVVAGILESLSAVLTEVGPAVIGAAHLEEVCKLTLAILERKAPCQIDEEDEEAVASTEQSEWDADLIRAAGDLVSTLAIVFGPEFAPAFNAFLPAMAQYVDPSRQPTERSAAIGALAESINGLKNGVTQFTESILSLLSRSLVDSDLDVRSNSAFAVGSLIFNSEVDLSSQYLTILQNLVTLFDRTTDTTESNQACDNACGAVARIILKNADALPLDQVLPTFIGCLPIRQDFIENVKVFDAIVYLLQSGKAGAQSESILQIIAGVMAVQVKVEEDERPLTPESANRVVELLRQMPPAQLQATGLAQYVQ